MKRIASILALFLGLMSLQSFSSAAAPAEPVQSRHLTGQGSIDTIDQCIETFVEVFVVQAWDHQPPGPPTDVTSSTLEIIQSDTCAGTTLHHIIAAIEGVSFSADNQLRSGELSAYFPNFRDIFTGQIVYLTANVTWTGTEELTVSRSHEVLDTDDGRINVKTSYSERVGTMAVSVTGDFLFEGTGYGFLGLTEGQSVRVHGA